MVVTGNAAKHGGAGVKPEGGSKDIEIEDGKRDSRNVKDLNCSHCDSNNSISSLICFSFLFFFFVNVGIRGVSWIRQTDHVSWGKN